MSYSTKTVSGVSQGGGFARKKFSTAIQSGEIIRPDECSNCGAVGNIHGHHTDYSKPLEVEWLCAKCHGKVHVIINEGKIKVGKDVKEVLTMETLGERIKSARLQAGLSVEDAAKQVQATRQAWYFWESNQYQPHISFLPKISDLLNISLDWIIRGKGNPPQ